MDLRANKNSPRTKENTRLKLLTMAKLFKTISLEDRYKDSRFNNAPVKPKFVVQGTVVLQAIKSTKEFESILLKSLPSAQEKNSIILKSIKGNIDVTKKAPTISLVFRSPIGLVDRIKQPYTNPIAQSPAIGLSDLYNNLIKITPFGILNQISKVVVKPATTILSQGLSYITVNIPTYDSLLLQGTFFNSGAYYSNIVPIISITSQQLSQGTTQALSTPVLTASVLLAQGTTLQGGSITTVQPSSSTNVILLKYGNYWFLNQLQITRPLEFLTQSEDVKLQKPRNLIKLVNVEIYAPNKVLKQGTINIRNNFPTRFQPKREGPILRLAGFAADRALAYFSPRVKHGSADLSKSETSKGYFTKAGILFSGNTFDDTQFDIQDRSEQLTLMADAIRTEPQAPSDSKDLDLYLSVNEESPTDLNKKDRFVVDFQKLESYVTEKDTYGYSEKLPLNKENAERLVKESRPFYDSGETPSKNNTSPQKPTEAVKNAIPLSEEYGVLSYSAIMVKGKPETKNAILPGADFRLAARESVDPIADKKQNDFQKKNLQIAFPPSPKKLYKQRFIPWIGDDDEKGYVEEKSPLHLKQTNLKSDFVKLSVNGVLFRAYITAFSDGVTATYNTVEGGSGTINAVKTIASISRSGNVSFKVVSLSQSDQLIMVAKLQGLTNTVTPIDKPNTGYVLPLVRLIVGNLFQEFVYIESIKFDIQPSDYSWDIDYQLPQIVDVAISFAVNTGEDTVVNNLAPFVSIKSLEKIGTKIHD
jgi:hypothetical protein